MRNLSLYDSGRTTSGSARLLASPSGYVRATGTTSTSAVAAGEGHTNGTSSQSSSDDHVGEAGLPTSDRQTHPVGHLDVNLVAGALLRPRHPRRSELVRTMEEEFAAFIINNTWDVVPRPVGSNVVTGKWIFKHKLNSDCSLERYKARWVLRGFTQWPDVDYDETYNPVVKPATVHTVLSLAVSRSWPVHQLDVKNVFLHGTLSETVYYSQPTGFVDPAQPDRVCLLNKSLYGLKQAPQAWYNRFTTYITSLGFVEAKSDTSLFVFQCGTDTMYLLLYVDDIVLTASNAALLQQTISVLKREFVMKDLEPRHYFMGVSVQHQADRFFLTQR
jgi:hypothetical protein